MEDSKFRFSIVDINRMRFEEMGVPKELQNFSQIGAGEEEMKIAAREYAELMTKMKMML